MRYSGLMQAERSVTNFCSVVTNRRPVHKQIVFEIGETLQSGPSGSLEDLNHVDPSLNCGRAKDTPRNNNDDRDNRDNSALTLDISCPILSTTRPSTPLSPALPPISETHHAANSILVVNSESQQDTRKCHSKSVADGISDKSPKIVEESAAVCDSNTHKLLEGTSVSKTPDGCQSSTDLCNASEFSLSPKLISSISTSKSTEATSSGLTVVESLKTITTSIVAEQKKEHQGVISPDESANKLRSSHNKKPSTSEVKSDTPDSSSIGEYVQNSCAKVEPGKAKAVTPKPVSLVRRQSRRLSSLEHQETIPSEDSTSTTFVLKENKKIIHSSRTSQCPISSENKEKEMVRLIHEDDTKIEVFCPKKGNRTSKRLGSTDAIGEVHTVIKAELPSPLLVNSDTKSKSLTSREIDSDIKAELSAPRETRLTRNRRSSCRSDRSESEISIDDLPSSVDIMVDKTAKRGRPRSGKALLDECPDSLVKCNGGTQLLNGAYKMKKRRASCANSDETDNTTHCRTNGVHPNISEKVDIKDKVSSVDKKQLENRKCRLRRRTVDQQHLSETESVENEKDKIMKNRSKDDIDRESNTSEICVENKETKIASYEQGSEKANAGRTSRIKGKLDKSSEQETDCSDDPEHDKVPVRRKIGRPRGSFKNKKITEVKEEENDGEDEEDDTERRKIGRPKRSFKNKKINEVKEEENDGEDEEEDEEKRKKGRPKGSFKNKKIIEMKGEEDDEEEDEDEESKSSITNKGRDKLGAERRGRPEGSRNRKTRYDLALLNEDDDDIFFGFPEVSLTCERSPSRSKDIVLNVSQKPGRPSKVISPNSKEKEQKKRMSDAERFLRDNREYYNFQETSDRLRSKSERSPGTKTDEEHEEKDQSKSKEEFSPKENSVRSPKNLRIRKIRRETQSSAGSNDDDLKDKPSGNDSKSPQAKRRLSHKDSDDSESHGKKFSEIQNLKDLKEKRQAEERDSRTRNRLEERVKRREHKEEVSDKEEEHLNEDIKVKEAEKCKEKNVEKKNPNDEAKIKSKEEIKSKETITEDVSSRSKRRMNRESKIISNSEDEKLDKEDDKKIFVKDVEKLENKLEKKERIQIKSQYEESDMFGKDVAELYFSFETAPEQESWYQTYQRFIDGIAENEFVYEDDPLRFVLPYEMPKEYIREEINSIRRSMLSKKKQELAELARKSPRCHASTLAILSDIVPTRKSSRSIKSEYSSNSSSVTESTASNTSTTTAITTTAITTSKGGSTMELAASTFSTSSCASPSPSTSTHTSGGSAPVSLEGSTGGTSDHSCDMDILAQHIEQVMEDSIGEIPPAPESILIQKITGESSRLLDESPDLKKTPPKKRGKKKRILAKRESEYSSLCDSYLASDVDQAFIESLREESKESLQLYPDNILTCDSSTVLEDLYKCGCTDRMSCDDFSSADEGTEASSVASFCDSETIEGSITSETKRARVTSKRRKNLTGWPKVKKKKKTVVASHTDTDDNDSALGGVDDLEPKNRSRERKRIMHNSYDLLEPMSSEDLNSLDLDRRASPRKRNSVYYMDSWQFRYRTLHQNK